MGWATGYIDRLRKGETVQFRPRGNSMAGRVESGDLCTVAPVTDPSAIRVDDVVLCKVNGCQYLHLVTAVQGNRFQISNNKGHINGWIGPKSLFGRLVRIG